MASSISLRAARLTPLLNCGRRDGGGTAPAAARSCVFWRRRAPLVGAFCVLSLGALSGIAARTGWASSQDRFPVFLWWKAAKQTAVGTVRSIRMDSSSSSVPSIVVYVTVPNKDAGKKLAESIIQEKLAACVNRIPGVESVYWWDGKVQTDNEEVLIIKTRESLLEALTEHVKSNHEYEVPAVVALPIIGGNAKYLEWIKSSTRDD